MTCVRRTVLLGTVLGILVSVAIAGSGSKEKRFPIPAHGTLELDVPDALDALLDQPADGGPPAIAMRPKQTGDTGVIVVVSWREPGDNDFGSDTYLQRVLREKARPYLDQLKLADVPLTRLTGGKNPGYACSMTDNALVGKPPEPGNFPFMRLGVVTTGDLVLTYMILMYSQTPDPVPKLEPMFLNARQRASEKGTR